MWCETPPTTATRPGVEVLRGEHSNQPATKKQQAYIQRLLRDFPGAEELLEYEGYRNTPTQANADTFIRQVQEDFAEPVCAAFPFFTLFISLINASLKFEAAGSFLSSLAACSASCSIAPSKSIGG